MVANPLLSVEEAHLEVMEPMLIITSINPNEPEEMGQMLSHHILTKINQQKQCSRNLKDFWQTIQVFQKSNVRKLGQTLKIFKTYRVMTILSQEYNENYFNLIHLREMV